MDLHTDYMGLSLHSPLVASASPLTGKLDSLRALEDAGAAAVVLPSLFEEQIREERAAMQALMDAGKDAIQETQDFFPDVGIYSKQTDKHLELVAAASKALDIPIIASLNGTTPDGWAGFARELSAAGAHAIELNLYHIGCNPNVSSSAVETAHEVVVRSVCGATHIPVSVKLSLCFSNLAHFCKKMESAGVKALVLFNRFYQPVINPETLEIDLTLHLSSSIERHLPETWIAMLRPALRCQLAHTTGIHTPLDVVSALMAGADVVMSTSALLQNGPAHLQTLRQGLEQWMNEHNYADLQQLRGCMARDQVPHPERYERTNYQKLLATWTPET